MSIDVDVKLGDAPVTIGELIDALESLAEDWRARDGQAIVAMDVPPEGAQHVFGSAECVFRLGRGQDVLLDVGVHSIGPELEHGEEGGWWVWMNPGRNDQAILFMGLAASCLARQSHGKICDDQRMFGNSRWQDPDRILAEATAHTALPFAEAASEYRKRSGRARSP